MNFFRMNLLVVGGGLELGLIMLGCLCVLTYSAELMTLIEGLNIVDNLT